MNIPVESGPKIIVKNKNRFGIVPDAILEKKSLSPVARVVAAWLVGRGDGFVVRVEAMCGMLGLSEWVWGRVRKELESLGWWSSSKRRGPGGTFIWDHEFEFRGENPPIPKFARDGETSIGNTRHG